MSQANPPATPDPVTPDRDPVPSGPVPSGSVTPDRDAARRIPYRELFAVREYRTLFAAELASLLGDQAAAVALAVLLYQRTGSALVAALGYATAYLPWTVGAMLLTPLADRMPPRSLLVACDLVRAGLIGLAAVPGLPLPLVGLLVLVAAFLAPPFEAAHSALLPEVLPGDRYGVALSLANAVHQGAQLAGFLLGGALVAVVSPAGALGIDAVSFAASGLLLLRGLVHRPAAAGSAGAANVLDGSAAAANVLDGSAAGGSAADRSAVDEVGDGAGSGPRRHLPARLLAEATAGLRVVAADRHRYGPLLVGVIGAGYAIVPEALAPAYVHRLGYGAPAVGLVMASVAAGSVAGNLALGRFATAVRRRTLMWPMAFTGTLPLLAAAARPGLWLSVVLFALAGSCAAFQVAANTAFVEAVPPALRGRAFGVAMTGVYGVQAVAIVTAGAAATVLEPGAVVAGAAVLGGLALLGLRMTALRSEVEPVPRAELTQPQVAC